MSSLVPEMAISPSAFLATGIVLVVVTAVLVTIRIGANARYTKKLLVSDYMAILAVVFLAGSFGTMYGILLTFKDIGSSILTLQKYGVAVSFVTGTAMWTSKAPILLLFIRLFGVSKPLRFTCYAILFFTAVAYLLGAAIPSALCTPKAVDFTDPMALMNLALCSKRSSQAGVALGVVSLTTDLIILVIPLPFITKMHLPFDKKIGLIAVFLVGIFAIIASAVSLSYKVKSFLGTSSESTIAMLSTIIECAIAIIVSCAPGMYCFGTNFAKSALYSRITSTFSRTSVTSRSKASSKLSSKASSIKKETQYTVVEEDNRSTKSLRPHVHEQHNLADLEANRR